MAPVNRALVAGKRFGDYFNEKYFALDPEGRAKWDKVRVFHHGALGEALVKASLAGLSVTTNKHVERALSTTASFGYGLMESDAHDKDRWWTEGRLLAVGAIFVRPLRRRRND